MSPDSVTVSPVTFRSMTFPRLDSSVLTSPTSSLSPVRSAASAVAASAASSAARDEMSSRAERAHAQGHAAGYAEGLRLAAVDAAVLAEAAEAAQLEARFTAEARIERMVELLSAAAAALEARTVPVVREVEHTLVVTALELAEAVLSRELSNADTSAQRALERAIDQPTRVDVQGVRMHPDDLNTLGSATDQVDGVTFHPDASLSPGDAVVDFADGYLDARVSTAFERAKSALLGTLS
ncbi:MAG: FliH/SctL family protein [Cryobacterium sp.]